mmetsp:Transcript_14878/g.21124  ORF Transcript_14878/g.21124 Transcript_14878/m.21124 type:complete len:649 (-) Transcript_14878:710-2656(-)
MMVPAVAATPSIVVAAAAAAMVVVGRSTAVPASIIVEFPVVLTTSLAVISPVKNLIEVVVLKRFTLKNEVGETSADFTQDAPSAGSVTDSSTILRGKVRLHRFNQADSLRVCRHRQCPLHDIIAKGIHHQLSDTVRIVQLVKVFLSNPVGATLKAFLHYVGTEFLDGKQTNLSNHTFADGMNFIVPTYVQNVLHNVVTISILHQLEGLLNNPCYEVRTCSAVTRIETALDYTTSMTVTSHIFDTGSNCIKYELRVLIRKFEKNTLDGVITMTVDTKTCGSGFKGISQDLGSGVFLLLLFLGFLTVVILLLLLGCLLLFLLLVFFVFFLVDCANFDNLLDGPRTMQIQTRIDQPGANTLDKGDPLIRSNTLQNLLKEIVSKGVHHGLSPKGQTLIQNGSGGSCSIFIESLLEETTSHLITRETTNIPKQRTEGRSLGRRVEIGKGAIGTQINLISLIVLGSSNIVQAALGLVVIRTIHIAILLQIMSILLVLTIRTATTSTSMIFLGIIDIPYSIVTALLLLRNGLHHHDRRLLSTAIALILLHWHHNGSSLTGHLDHLHRLQYLLSIWTSHGHVKHLLLLLRLLWMLLIHGHGSILRLLLIPSKGKNSIATLRQLPLQQIHITRGVIELRRIVLTTRCRCRVIAGVDR